LESILKNNEDSRPLEDVETFGWDEQVPCSCTTWCWAVRWWH
jgi:hypothetical protein